MDRFNSEPAFVEPALVVIPPVSLKVPSCGIVLCLRLLLLCLRSSKRNAVGLSLVFGGGAFFCFARAPQIHNISHKAGFILRSRSGQASNDRNRVISLANIGRVARQDVPLFRCAMAERDAELGLGCAPFNRNGAGAWGALAPQEEVMDVIDSGSIREHMEVFVPTENTKVDHALGGESSS